MARPRIFGATPAAVAGAQRLAGKIADELAANVRQLEEVLSSLPRSAREDAMLELRIPSDVPTEVRTIVECVVHDLRPAILSLLKAGEDLPPGVPRRPHVTLSAPSAAR